MAIVNDPEKKLELASIGSRNLDPNSNSPGSHPNESGIRAVIAVTAAGIAGGAVAGPVAAAVAGVAGAVAGGYADKASAT
jgi:hypothetical protein